jgi:hypothetical protein
MLIDSHLTPEAVLRNIRATGHAVIPEDLAKLKVSKMSVMTRGSTFEMHWVGPINPLFYYMCVGEIVPTENGCRVNAVLKKDRRAILFWASIALMGVLALMGPRSTVDLILSAFMLSLVAFVLLRRRTAEPMRTRLVEALESAATGILREGEARTIVL